MLKSCPKFLGCMTCWKLKAPEIPFSSFNPSSPCRTLLHGPGSTSSEHRRVFWSLNAESAQKSANKAQCTIKPLSVFFATKTPSKTPANSPQTPANSRKRPQTGKSGNSCCFNELKKCGFFNLLPGGLTACPEIHARSMQNHSCVNTRSKMCTYDSIHASTIAE